MIIDLQTNVLDENLPSSSDFKNWAKAVFAELGKDDNVELTIRLTDNDEVQKLNLDYRGKDKPTNILSFPFESIDVDLVALQTAYAGDVFQLDVPFVGDLVVAVPVMENEAAQQNKELFNHYAHIVIHGLLHLLGYDHIDEAEAESMESLEINILKKLGIDNPYL